MSDPTDGDPADSPLRDHLIVGALQPAMRLAFGGQTSLKALRALLDIAYYGECRRRGLSDAQVGEAMGRTTRTAQDIRRNYKAFFAVEQDHGLPRRIEYLLGIRARAEPELLNLVRATHHLARAEFDEALGRLIAAGRVERRGDRLQIASGTQHFKLVRDEEGPRLDGVHHLMESVARTIEARFYRDPEQARARTTTFRMRPADKERLEALSAWIEMGFELLEDAGRGAEPTVEVTASLNWTIHDTAPG